MCSRPTLLAPAIVLSVVEAFVFVAVAVAVVEPTASTRTLGTRKALTLLSLPPLFGRPCESATGPL